MTNLQPGVLEEPPATELFLIPDEVSAVLRVSRGDLKRLRVAGQAPERYRDPATAIAGRRPLATVTYQDDYRPVPSGSGALNCERNASSSVPPSRAWRSSASWN